MPDRAWDGIRDVQGRLAGQSCHRGLSVADHLVVATALRHRLTVLHEEEDFVAASRVLPELGQQRISQP